MLKQPETPVYRIISDESASTFYEGHGLWTRDRQEAQVFNSLPELVRECMRHRIVVCHVIEFLPRTQEYSLTLTPPEG